MRCKECNPPMIRGATQLWCPNCDQAVQRELVRECKGLERGCPDDCRDECSTRLDSLPRETE